MGWNAQIGRDLRVLDSIVAILLSMAGLAERAAGAPLPVRWFVLWILRYAEAVAQEFVAGSTCGAVFARSSPAGISVRQGGSSTDAIELAVSLSRLAWWVAATVARLRRQAFLHQGRSSGKSLDRGLRQAIPGAFGMAFLQGAHPDTS
jgi:hypothetical protein